MITKTSFLKPFQGQGAYSSFKVMDVSVDDCIAALNRINPDMCVGSGQVTGRSVSFEICDELPDLLTEITGILHCRGFADIGAWYGSGYFVAACDGEEHDDYTAEWKDDMPERLV